MGIFKSCVGVVQTAGRVAINGIKAVGRGIAKGCRCIAGVFSSGGSVGLAAGGGAAALAAASSIASAQEASTVNLSVPQIVDWGQVSGVVVTYVGAGVVIVSGVILGFAVVKKLLGRIGSRAA